MGNNASVPGSKANLLASAETTKRTAAKSAAATIVTNMATDVTNGDFAAAAKKAGLLVVAYGNLAAARLP